MYAAGVLPLAVATSAGSPLGTSQTAIMTDAMRESKVLDRPIRH